MPSLSGIKGAQAVQSGQGQFQEGTSVEMTLLNRYIFRQLVSTFFLITIVATSVVWFSRIVRMIDLMIDKRQGIGIFLELSMLVIPGLLSIITPLALFIATIYTLHRLNTDSELVVIYATGMQQRSLAVPFVLLASFVFVLVIIINSYLMPASLRLLREKIIAIRADVIASIMQEGKFTSPEKNLYIYVRERKPNGELVSLLVHDERAHPMTTTYLARRGQIKRKDDNAYLIMSDGYVQHKKSATRKLEIVAFKTYTIDLSAFSKKAVVPYYKPKERTINYLLNPDPEDPYFKHAPGKFRSEAHDRLANPLYALALTLIAFAILGVARTSRRNRGMLILLAAGLGIAIRIAGMAAVNLSVKKAWAVILIYAIPAGAIILTIPLLFISGTLLYYYRRKPAPLPSLPLAGKAG